jgi:hypothetical protein
LEDAVVRTKDNYEYLRIQTTDAVKLVYRARSNFNLNFPKAHAQDSDVFKGLSLDRHVFEGFLSSLDKKLVEIESYEMTAGVAVQNAEEAMNALYDDILVLAAAVGPDTSDTQKNKDPVDTQAWQIAIPETFSGKVFANPKFLESRMNAYWTSSTFTREEINQKIKEMLDHRDPVGATPLLMLCLYNQTAHLDAFNHICKFMKENDLGPEFLKKQLMQSYTVKREEHVSDDVTCTPYEGETSLHLAIVHYKPQGDKKLVELLLEYCPELLKKPIHKTASFFGKKGQKFSTTYHGVVSADGLSYHGEFPLSFAVAMEKTKLSN